MPHKYELVFENPGDKVSIDYTSTLKLASRISFQRLY
jgi:hypothetical protein